MVAEKVKILFVFGTCHVPFWPCTEDFVVLPILVGRQARVMSPKLVISFLL